MSSPLTAPAEAAPAEAAPAALISAQKLRLRRARRVILEDVSLTIHTGDFITLIGPNGAGKTTLLKCLLGILTPQQGKITRRGNIKIGYVPQKINAAMTMPINLRRFLTLSCSAGKRANSGGDAQAALAEVAAQTGISHLLDTPLTSLSGGEVQRAMLARALTNKPDLLVLDEPTQHLDIGGELAFYKLLDDIHAVYKPAVVMVSHDLHFVMRRSRQVVCLYHHICCSGAPQRVKEDPAFLQLFGGELSDLLTVYQHAHNHTHD